LSSFYPHMNFKVTKTPFKYWIKQSLTIKPVCSIFALTSP
jgi:beta-lactamase class D